MCCYFLIFSRDIKKMSRLFLSFSSYHIGTTKEGCTYGTSNVHPIFACVLITHCSFGGGFPITIRNQYMGYRLLL